MTTNNDTSIKIYIPKAIIPVVPRNKILHDYALVTRENTIIDLLPLDAAKTKYSSGEIFELPQHAITPGFINLHGHAAMTLFRGLADDLPLMEWLNEHIWPAEGAWVSHDFVRDGSKLAIAEMIKCGTTYFSDMYFFPEACASAVNEAGIKAQLCCPLLDFPTAWGTGPEDYLSKTKALAEQYKDHDLITIAIGPHAPYTVSDTPFLQAIELANELSLNVQVHLHETQNEVDESKKQIGQRPISRLNDLGLFDIGSRLQCVHMTSLDSNDIKIVASSNASVIHCPESNLKLASGFCPVDQLACSNINIALGTDGAASNNDLDILGEIRTAALLAKATSNNAAQLNAMHALEIITINGARALNLEAQIGSIEIGKRADFIAIKLDELNTTPCYNLISNIVYSASSTQVTHSWINGQPVMLDRQLQTLNEAEITNKAHEWATKIQANQP